MNRPASQPIEAGSAPAPNRQRAAALLVVSFIVFAGATTAGLLLPRSSPLRFAVIVVLAVSIAPFIASVIRWLRARRAIGQTGPVEMVIFSLVLFLLMMIPFYLFTGTIMAGVAMAAWMAPLYLGTSLIAFGIGKRDGKQRVCAKCDYDFIEPTDDEPSPPRCPECGREWLRFDGTAVGRRTRAPKWIWIGVAVLAFGGLAFAAQLGSAGLAKRLPTSVLITQVLNASQSVYPAWQELSKRTLDAAQTRRLATAVLDNRRAGERSGIGDGGDWLESQLLANTLPPDLVQRFYQDSFSPRLFAPKSARVGQKVTVRLSGPYVSFAPGIDSPSLLLLGFFVNDNPEPREDKGRQGKTLYPHEVSYIAPPDRNPNDQYFLGSPSVTVTPDHAGPLRVRANGLVYYGPWGFNNTIVATVSPDGRYIIPPGSVYSREVDLEATILVEP